MSEYKTVVASGLASLGADPTKPSYFFMSIFKANRPSDDVLPPYQDTLDEQNTQSSLRRMMQYGLWSQTNIQPYIPYTTKRKNLILPLPMKMDGVYYGDKSQIDGIQTYTAAFRKVLGCKPSKIVSNLKSQSGNNQYQHITVVFGVPANTTDRYMLSVLFDTLNNARLQNITDLGYDSKPEYELLYDCNLTALPIYERGDGLLPGMKHNDCVMTHGQYTDTQGQPVYDSSAQLVLTRQNKDYWERLSGFDIQGKRDVHSWKGDNETVTLTWSSEMTKSSMALFVPITFDDIQTHQRLKKVTPLTNLAMIQCTLVKIIKIPWYAQSWFKWIIIVIMVIITIVISFFTIGLGTGPMIAADSAVIGALAIGISIAIGELISATLISAIMSALVDMLIAVVIEEILKAILKPLIGKKLAGLISGIAGALVGAFASGSGGVLNIIDAVIKVAMRVSSYIFSENLQHTLNKMNDLNTWEFMKSKEINDHWEANGMQIIQKTDLEQLVTDPVMRFQLSQPEVDCRAIVMTGYDVADIKMSEISEHYTNGTTTSVT